MDLKKYNILREKINGKDFEGNNAALNNWLHGFSFIGNFGSIFFAYFLVFPSLLKAISINLISGIWGSILAFLFTTTFLVIFEIIKRYLLKNFSSDFVENNRRISVGIVGWFGISVAIISLSFYLSLVGAKNLAITSLFKNDIAEAQIITEQDSISKVFENKKIIYLNENTSLRLVNVDLRQKLAETPLNYLTARKDYQTSIDKNTQNINENQLEINKVDDQLVNRVVELKKYLGETKNNNKSDDNKNITLFIIIAIFIEIIIVGGIYFREWYEFRLFQINHDKFEKIYQKKERYRALISFIYHNGKLVIGDKVLSTIELKVSVADKTTIQKPNKFIDEFLHDMNRLGIFVTVGKRRNINVSYDEALNIIENYDEGFRVLENMK